MAMLFMAAAHAQESAKVPASVPLYQPKFYPYENGEQASYKASWNGVPVATAEIETTPSRFEGKKSLSGSHRRQDIERIGPHLENAGYHHLGV